MWHFGFPEKIVRRINPSNRIRVFGVLFSLLLGCSSTMSRSPGKLPEASDKALITKLLSIAAGVDGAAQWSPDGSRILFSSTALKSGLWTINANGGTPQQLIAGTDIQIPRWSPDAKTVAYMSAKGGYPELWLAYTSGADRQLTKLGARINAFSWSPDGQWIAFSANRNGTFDIWKVKVASGQIYRLTAGREYATYPAWTPDSQHIVYVRTDDAWINHDIIVMDANGGSESVVMHDKDWFDYGTIWTNSSFGYPQVSPDGKQILFRSYRSGWINYWIVGLEGGEAKPLSPESADQSDAQWSTDGQQVAYITNHDGTTDLRVFSIVDGIPNVLFAPRTGLIASPHWSPDGSQISYVLATPTTPADIFAVSLKKRSTRQLTQSVPATATVQRLTEPEKISFASSNGFVISAYLYKPETPQTGTATPAIMWIHGGPTSQFTDTYSALVQFFVRKGFVVLLPNIRGSSGYGKRFEDANNGCWGHCDLEDVLAGVKYLKTLPYVDPKKIGITGTSYGGCMSMSAAAFAPGVFQAAIPMSGYGDWVSFMTYNTELRHTKLLAYELGPFPEKKEIYKYVSPVNAVSSVTTPVFLVQGGGPATSWRPGEDDPPASLEFARALEEAYKVYRYKSYVNHGEPSHVGPYYVSGRENTAQLALDMLDFLNQYLKDNVVDSFSRARANTTSPDHPAGRGF